MTIRKLTATAATVLAGFWANAAAAHPPGAEAALHHAHPHGIEAALTALIVIAALALAARIITRWHIK